MAHLVISSVQPGGTVGTQMRAVEVAVSARAQRARQRGVQATAQHARRPGSRLPTSGSSLDAARVNEGMTADAEVDTAGYRARRTVDNCRTTELKTSSTNASPHHRTVFPHSA